ncbi:MAG: FHA domain-containing protein [Myxococcales bacterium]|nr:FHA domain-containing protein [Myxococcales bacterium]
MTASLAPFSAVLRGAVPAVAGAAVLAVPGLPDTAKIAAAFLLVLGGAWLTATAGRSRLDGVRARFVPPEVVPVTDAQSAMLPLTVMPMLIEPPPVAVAPAAYAPIAASSAPVPYAPPLPFSPPSAAAPVPTEPRGPDAVYLGPSADPAFPAWQLHWQMNDGRQGVVPLPTGAQIKLGRHSESHVVVVSDEVSRTHLVFTVSRQGVQVADGGGANGSWLRVGEGNWQRLAAQQEVALKTWDQLRISDPWALVLTLEPAGH